MTDFLTLDGFEDCLAGVVTRFGQEPITCYDLEKIIAKLVSEGLSHEEAVEHFEFNIIGAYVGEATPCFIQPAADYPEFET